MKNDIALDELQREGELLRSLDHPNVVKYEGIWISPLKEMYLVLEYYPLGSLDHFLRVTQDVSAADLVSL
jgi:serine/threonine protein kinase